MRICVTVTSEMEFRTCARFVGCRTRRRTLGRPDSSNAGTRGCRTRCRTLGRPELVGRRNSWMPELAAGLLRGRNSSDAGTRRCRNPPLNSSLLSSRITSFNQLPSSDFSLFWPVCSPYIGRAKSAGTRLMEGVAADSYCLHYDRLLTGQV